MDTGEIVERYVNLLDKLQGFPPAWERTMDQEDRIDGIVETLDHYERLLVGMGTSIEAELQTRAG